MVVNKVNISELNEFSYESSVTTRKHTCHSPFSPVEILKKEGGCTVLLNAD